LHAVQTRCLRGGKIVTLGRKNGRGDWIRTSDPLLPKQESEGCNESDSNALQTGDSSVTPDVTPDSQKAAILAALRGMDPDELRALLAEALNGKGEA